MSISDHWFPSGVRTTDGPASRIIFRVSQPRPYDVRARTSAVWAGGPHFAWVSDSRMNIEAHEHNPQLPAEGIGSTPSSWNFTCLQPNLSPTKGTWRKASQRCDWEAGLIPTGSSFVPTPFYF